MDASGFFGLVRTPGKFQAVLRDRLKHIAALVQRALHDLGVANPDTTMIRQRTWELLSRLAVPMPRLESPDETDWAGVANSLVSVARGSDLTAAFRLRDRLVALASEYSPNSARVDLELLRRDAHSLLDPTTRRHQQGWQVLDHLHRQALALVRDEITATDAGRRVRLDRSAAATELLSKAADTTAVVVSGESGVGKSALTVLGITAVCTAEADRFQASSLRVLSNADVTLALDVRGILYVEDYTDIDILRAWAQALHHRAARLLTTEVMWKPVAFHLQQGRPGRGITAREHFRALQLVRDDLPGLALLDGDALPAIEDTPITGNGLQRLRWRRYEIESYLLHPEALARFVAAQVGPSVAPDHVDGMLTWWGRELPPAVADDPLGDHPFLNGTKARTELLPPLLEAAEIFGLSYTRYHEIAALMRPEEIHPEVTDKLNGICRAFGVEP